MVRLLVCILLLLPTASVKAEPTLFGIKLGMTHANALQEFNSRGYVNQSDTLSIIQNTEECETDPSWVCEFFRFRSSKMTKEMPLHDWPVTHIEYFKRLQPRVRLDVILQRIESQVGSLTQDGLHYGYYSDIRFAKLISPFFTIHRHDLLGRKLCEKPDRLIRFNATVDGGLMVDTIRLQVIDLVNICAAFLNEQIAEANRLNFD